MARRKRSGHKSRKIPLLATAGAAVFALHAYDGYKQSGANGFAYNTIGVSQGTFHMDTFVANMMPLVAGVGGSMLASKTKANRYLAGIPMIKL